MKEISVTFTLKLDPQRYSKELAHDFTGLMGQ